MLRAIVRSGSGKSKNLECASELNFYYQQLDALRSLRQGVRRELLAESKKHKAWKRLCQIPSIGPIRAYLSLLLGYCHRNRLSMDIQTNKFYPFHRPAPFACGSVLLVYRFAA